LRVQRGVFKCAKNVFKCAKSCLGGAEGGAEGGADGGAGCPKIVFKYDQIVLKCLKNVF
jgi:hypothetical protein